MLHLHEAAYDNKYNIAQTPEMLHTYSYHLLLNYLMSYIILMYTRFVEEVTVYLTYLYICGKTCRSCNWEH